MSRVAIRADASASIGGGHVMRCLTLADLLADGGAEIVFCCSRETIATVAGLARSRHRTVVLDGALDEEPAQMAAAMADGVDLLVVDHYGWSALQETACRPMARRILVIDDLADRRHDCDVLADQNLGRNARDYDALVPAGTQLLIGPAYALLRPEFARARTAALARRAEGGPVKRMLVSMGLTDPTNATGAVLDALAALPAVARAEIEVRCVLGRSAPHLDAVREKAVAIGHNVSVLVDVTDMAAEMAAADLCIGAGGSSSWERCCLGLPTVVIVVAENQRAGAEALEREGAARSATVETRTLIEAIEVAGETANRSELSKRAARLVDGRGARRLVLMLDPVRTRDGTAITLRPIEIGDARRVHGWQCEPGARRYARNPGAPDWTEHLGWLERKLADPLSATMIILADGEAVGLLRLDPTSAQQHEVSILVQQSQLGRGIGKAALLALERLYPDYDRIADIDPENRASQKIFESAGYAQTGPRSFRRSAAQSAAAPVSQGKSK